MELQVTLWIHATCFIKTLPESSPDYYAEAFEIATEEDEIIPVKLEDGVEGYRLNPAYESED